jgi:hypothetical protein
MLHRSESQKSAGLLDTAAKPELRPIGFPPNTQYALSLPFIRSTSTAHLILLDTMTLTICCLRKSPNHVINNSLEQPVPTYRCKTPIFPFVSNSTVLHSKNRPASRSRGQIFLLLIMRSRVRFPVLPLGFYINHQEKCACCCSF